MREAVHPHGTANVTLTINAANQAPVASITSPASNVTVNPGGTVAFSGNGTDTDGSVTAFGWTFAGALRAGAQLPLLAT